jgi:lipid A 3-O-deacylase
MSKVSLLFLGGLAFAPLFAHAEDETSYDFRNSKDLSSLEFTTENDLYATLVTHGGDKYYTNGFKLAYVTPSLSGDSGVWNGRAHFGVAQEMYTAKDDGSSVPPAGDHPYSAWLYGMIGYGWEDESSLDLLTLRAGVVGPSALGQTVQDGYHRLAGEGLAKGWDSQLRDEPGVDIEWRRTWRSRLSGSGEGFGSDLLPRIGYEVGTVRHVGSFGTQVRFGKNLPTDFGVKTSRESAVSGAPVKFAGAGWSPDSYYGFADVLLEGRVWNMTLDGNMYHKGNGVPTNKFMAQGGFGLAAHWAGTRIAIAEYVRTEEFKGQSGPFWYGSLTASVAF